MKFLSGLILALFAGCAMAGTAVLTWTAPTINTDGSAITAALTYNVYSGPTCTALTQLQTGIGTATYTQTGLTSGTVVCYAVTAVENGIESAKSATVSATIPVITPGAPSQVVVVLH